jgi:hypothetical protein
MGKMCDQPRAESYEIENLFEMDPADTCPLQEQLLQRRFAIYATPSATTGRPNLNKEKVSTGYQKTVRKV